MFKLLIKGFIIGIGKILPGVSGAMLAITLGVYERAVKAISEFFKNPKENFKFLLPLGVGAITSIILASKLVLYCLNNYYLPTMLFFIGLIIGGIPILFKKIDLKHLKKFNYLIFALSFIFVFSLTLVGKQNFFVTYDNPVIGFFLFLIVGIIDASATVIPGVCGTALMMILGCYSLLITAISSLTSISNIVANLTILIPFLIGLIIGVIALSRTMNYLLSKHEKNAYCGILGFALASILSLFLQTLGKPYSVRTIVIALILLVLGIFIGKKMDK